MCFRGYASCINVERAHAAVCADALVERVVRSGGERARRVHAGAEVLAARGAVKREAFLWSFAPSRLLFFEDCDSCMGVQIS